MKIIWKDNFGRDAYAEEVVADNVHAETGRVMVDMHNAKFWDGESDSYLALVEDDYVLYDGYADLL